MTPDFRGCRKAFPSGAHRRMKVDFRSGIAFRQPIRGHFTIEEILLSSFPALDAISAMLKLTLGKRV